MQSCRERKFMQSCDSVLESLNSLESENFSLILATCDNVSFINL